LLQERRQFDDFSGGSFRIVGVDQRCQGRPYRPGIGLQCER
jgi:hypothetical protein